VTLRQRVKCVTDVNGYAIYFSRGVVPHNKDGAVRGLPPPFQHVPPYLLHLGLQCYDRAFLRLFCELAPTPLMVRHHLSDLSVCLAVSVVRLSVRRLVQHTSGVL
jgi:3-deoxy-manno-octulosonate cytidylyltransferase (CMP-KDO synthetase)